MTEKKSVLLLASAAALTLVLHETALSAPPEDESAPTAIAAPSSPPKAAEGQIPGPGPAFPKSIGTDTAAPENREAASPAPPPPPQSPAPETESSGVPEPPPPPQMPMAGTGGDQSQIMTPEERNALLEQRFQRMHERFMQQRQEMTERWNSYWKILDEMTPEQKEAIEAVFGSRKRPCSPRAMGRQMPPGMTMQPPISQPQYGLPSGSTFPGPGYGYGPQDAGPYPYERGPGASWGGGHPMYPGGGAEPWTNMDQGYPQGPPPPGGEHTQP